MKPQPNTWTTLSLEEQRALHLLLRWLARVNQTARQTAKGAEQPTKPASAPKAQAYAQGSSAD